MKNCKILRSLAIAYFILQAAVIAVAQTSTFTYQGKLTDGGTAASGSYIMEFRLFGSLGGSDQIGATISNVPVTVTNGVFTTRLDFGVSAFPGADRFLAIAVKKNAGDPYTPLSPRQQIDSSPYAIQTLKAQQADLALDSEKLGGVAANQYVQANDTRLSDERNPLPNSTYYIQNRTTQQPSTNFNISGNGTIGGALTASALSGNEVNAGQQFNLGGSRILGSGFGSDSLFAGIGAGQDTTGNGNAFFGTDAGRNTTTGGGNSFFGRGAGFQNTDGTVNAFFGDRAGSGNTRGSENAIFGPAAGLNTSTGNFNSFFGGQAGYSNAAGSYNAAFGHLAGYYNTGNFNSFFGSGTAYNSTGNHNAFFGASTGPNNVSGSFNTLLGYNADVGAGNLSYATALGAGAVVNASNTLVLGRGLDNVKIPGGLDVSGPVTGQFVLGTVNGGTGLSSPGTIGTFLRSNGTNWTSSLLQAADIPAGSDFYIRNSTAQQLAWFNISGDGAVSGYLRTGLSSQSHRFAVDIGPTWTTAGWGGSVEIANVGAIGWRPNTQGISFGIGQTNNGMHIFTTTSPLGAVSAASNNAISVANNGKVGIGTTDPTSGRLVIDRAIDNGVAIALTGSAIQNANSLGWAKALLFVDGGGHIHRCFNGVTGEEFTGSSPTGCGFSVDRTSFGGYTIDFPFGVRFATASTYYDSPQTLNHSATLLFQTNTRIIVRIFVTGNSSPEDLANRSFMLIVF